MGKFSLLFDPVVSKKIDYNLSDALFMADEYGLFNLLSQSPKSLEEIADVLQTDRIYLIEALLNSLISFKIVVYKNGTYANTPLAEIFLVKGGLLYQNEGFELRVPGCLKYSKSEFEKIKGGGNGKEKLN